MYFHENIHHDLMTFSICDEVIEEINRTLLVRTPLRKADLLFVFGTRHAVEKFAYAIETLWRGGFFRYLLISGGMTDGAEDTEAATMFRMSTLPDLRPECVILEEKALNTGENVVFSLPLLEQGIGLKNIRSVIALGKHCASARYLMTLERHWPEVEKMLFTVNHFDIPDAEWDRHPPARARIIAEWQKLERYKRLGYISDWHGTGNRR
ncbi:MAG: YdcF family protein [Janthinobacterium lividum]